MTRRAPSVLFAALFLVTQLLLGVSLAGASQAGSQPCDGCPGGHSSSLLHDVGSSGTDCATHCSDDGSTGTHQQGCGSGCAMAGSSHCGFSASPALTPSSPFHPVVVADAFATDRRAVGLPDSPLFDFLRPPTRG